MIGRWFALLLLWIALWGDISVVNIITGLLITAGLSLFFPGSLHSRHRIRLFPALTFFAYMLRSIVTSSWEIILSVLRPTEQRRHVEIVTVSLASHSALVQSVTANTISLTPGTIVLSINHDNSTMDIHVLGYYDSPDFQNHIHQHQKRVAAFIVEKS
jgi:multicomponent Na+:H+ antiporter subunit E